PPRRDHGIKLSMRVLHLRSCSTPSSPWLQPIAAVASLAGPAKRKLLSLSNGGFFDVNRDSSSPASVDVRFQSTGDHRLSASPCIRVVLSARGQLRRRGHLQIEKLGSSTMVDFLLFAHLVLRLLGFHEMTPKLLNRQIDPLELTSALLNVKFNPNEYSDFVQMVPWPLTNITVDPKLPKCAI
ncbi:unnamed protein product, partial [Brassica oleracea]